MGAGGPWGLSEVIAAGCGPVVKLWAPSEPQAAVKINEGTPVYDVDFSHNNKVLAVAGEKGRANLYSGKAAGDASKCSSVGLVPAADVASVESITCIKWAPNDSYLLGGCHNGQVYLWPLLDGQAATMGPLNGSITSVAVNASLTAAAASSASGHVVLGYWPSGKKMKTLCGGPGVSAPRVGCLSFAPTQPTLLCGAKGSGQLVVWDTAHLAQQAEEYHVHKAIVTGCTFAPNDDNLLISCGEDGLLACTDRRTTKIAWECKKRQSLASVSMRWDGSMVAVGTGDGQVRVHDTRCIQSTLSVQEFSDELPVTALCWQHMPSSKSHRSRASLGSAAVPAGSGSAASSSHRPGGTEAASSRAAVPARAAAQPAAQALAPAPRGVTASSKAGSVAPHRTPLVVPGWDSTTPQSHGASADSSEMESGMKVVSPMRMFSPLDSDLMLGLSGLSGPTSTAAAAAAGHTPESAMAQHTLADSTASGAGFRMQTVHTPALQYSGHGGNASVTPFGSLAADGAATSTAPAVAAPPEQLRDRRAGSAAAAASTSATAAAAGDRRGADSSQRTSAGGAAANLARPAAAKASDSTAQAAAAGGRGSRPSSAAGPSGATGMSDGAAGHRRKGSDASAAATTAVDRSSKSRPSSAGGALDSSNVQDRTTDASVAGKAAVGSASGVGASRVAAVGVAGGVAAGAQQQISSGYTGTASTSGAPAAAASDLAAVAAAGGGMNVTGSALREDVFKAYIDKRMDAQDEAIRNMHADMVMRSERAEANLGLVVQMLASRQDQLADAITQLTEAVKSLAVPKQQQQQYHTGVNMIPWI